MSSANVVTIRAAAHGFVVGGADPGGRTVVATGVAGGTVVPGDVADGGGAVLAAAVEGTTVGAVGSVTWVVVVIPTPFVVVGTPVVVAGPVVVGPVVAVVAVGSPGTVKATGGVAAPQIVAHARTSTS